MKEAKRKELEQIEREIAERQQRAAVILRESRVEALGGEKELRKAQKKALKESARQFASKMGIETKQGRRILESGRAAFDVNFNAREHGRRLDGFGGMGTLPPAA